MVIFGHACIVEVLLHHARSCDDLVTSLEALKETLEEKADGVK